MIDLDNVRRAIKGLIETTKYQSVSRIMIENHYLPDYHLLNDNTPMICREKYARLQCRDFYENLFRNITVEEDVICPFGFKLKCSSLTASSKKIYIITQLEHDFNIKVKEKIINFPRSSKKALKKALKFKQYSYNSDIAIANHDFLFNALEAILYGRVALSLKGLTHTIFTPLQGAMGDLNNIKEGIDKENSMDRLEKNMKSISMIAQQLQILLSDGFELKKNMIRKVNVRKMISEIIEHIKSNADDKFIVFDNKQNNTGHKVVEAIPFQLNIVLSNILQNAVKYSFNGYEENPLKIKIDYSVSGVSMVISIINEGCRIGEDEIREGKLFELGYRGLYSNDRDRTGTGTGLHIAQQLSINHDAKINIISVPIGIPSSPMTQRYQNTFQVIWPIYRYSEES